jgi:hypothetical protein
MGHDSHHGEGAAHTNPHATKESDTDLTLRIRPIELIKHNPNVFHVPLGVS